MIRSKVARFCLLAISVVSLTIGSCASKKFVRARIEPLDQRIEGLANQSGQTRKQLDKVGTTADRADERALSAGEQAAKAREQAVKAGEQAAKANRLAEEAGSRATENAGGLHAMDRRIRSLDNYRLAATETVLFGFNSSQLKPSEQMKIDRLASRLQNSGSYYIEIEGFTDRAGSFDYNLALSRRRADGVARYLTTKFNVPLRRLGILGFGSEEPAADNRTRQGRQANRRVEMRLYLHDVVSTAQQRD